MNYAKAGVFFFICWLVQTTLLWRVWPFGATPNLLLCAAVCFAWLYEANYGLVYAVVFGLMLDLQLQSLIGVQALALVLCCVPAMLMRIRLNPEHALPAVLAALSATFINNFSVWGIYHLFGAPAGFHLAARSLPELLVSQAVICLFLHLLFVRTIIRHRRDRRYVGGTM